MHPSWAILWRQAARFQALLERHWRSLLQLRGRFQVSEETAHLLLAAGVGLLGGLVNLGFHEGSELLKHLLLGGEGDWTELAAELHPWHRLLIPAIGGLLAGGILFGIRHLLRLPDTGNLLEVVAVGDGHLHFRSAFFKSVASLLSISSGGSIGREGPLIHLSATLASKAGQFARWPPYRLRLLVACGAAAGIAGAYNAPIAGAVFAAQIVLGTFSMSLFGPLVVASVVSAVFSRSFFGIEPWYDVPSAVQFTHVAQLPWFMVLGLVTGTVGAGFLILLQRTGPLLTRFLPPLWARLAVCGLLVGAIATEFPEVWGNGYRPASDILHDRFDLQFVALLLAAKLVATLLTVGSGAVGGIVTPTLFLGAGFGAVFGLGLHHLQLAHDLPTSAFALVGMGSLLAATTHSPLLAMILVFEICLNYSLVPPLMVACALATLAARRFHPDSIYTEPLRRRGLLLDRDSTRPGSASERTVGDILRPPVAPFQETTRFREMADRFLSTPHNYLPVVNPAQQLVGLVALEDLKQYLNVGDDLEGVIAFDVMRPPPPCLTPDQRVVDAVPILLASVQRHVPVVNTTAERKLIGSVERAEALGLLTEAIGAVESRRT